MSSLTNSANILNDVSNYTSLTIVIAKLIFYVKLVDKHNALSGIRDDSRMGGGFMKRRRGPMAFGMMGDWDRGI